MYVQIINKKLTKNNKSLCALSHLNSKLMKLGWKKADCEFKQVRDELVETKYKGADGKTIAPRR
jgi:hypothetical protein